MVVSQMRGVVFEVTGKRPFPTRPFPTLATTYAAWETIKDVAQAFGFRDVDEYLANMAELGPKLLERLREGPGG